MNNRYTLYSIILLLAILALGLYLRYESASGTTVISPLRADAGAYFMYAYNLRHKNVYSNTTFDKKDLDHDVIPDAIRPPGYPLFLMPFINGLPNKMMLNRIYIIQALISSITILLSYFIYRSFLSGTFSLITSLMVALSPHLIICNSYILTETLFCLLIVTSVLMLVIFLKKPSLLLALIIGVMIGITSLTRSSLQFFPIFLLISFIIYYNLKKGTYFFLILLIGFAISFSPWIIRNLHTLGKPTDNRLMINFLHHGLYPNFTFNDKTETFGFPYRYDPRSKIISKDVNSVIKEIRHRFSKDFIKHAKWFILIKPLFFWQWDIIQGMGDIFIYPVTSSPYFTKKTFLITNKLMWLLHWPFTILCAFGCILSWFPFPTHILSEKALCVSRLISILLFYYTAMHMIGAPFPRYSIPLRPFFYGMALFQLQSLFSLTKYYFTKNRQPSP